MAGGGAVANGNAVKQKSHRIKCFPLSSSCAIVLFISDDFFCGNGTGDLVGEAAFCGVAVLF